MFTSAFQQTLSRPPAKNPEAGGVHWRIRRWAVVAASSGLAITLTGCGGVADSLRLSNAVLVKIPCDGTKPFADAGHWHFQHALQGPQENGRTNHWYLVWNDQQPDAKAFGQSYWPRLLADAPAIAAATREKFGADPLLIEPNHTFRLKASAKLGSESDRKTADANSLARRRVAYGEPTTPAWPDVRRIDAKTRQRKVDAFWYRGDDYSELESARRAVGPARDGERIRIGHLDNGLDGDHPAAPRHLVRGDRWANAVGLLRYAEDLTRARQSGSPTGPLLPPDPPEQTKGTHGMGTIGLLAGGRVHLPEQTKGNLTIARYDGYVGGAPEAEVVPVRVAPWVASLSTGELAYAIDYASRVEKCDVISMSHGGAPSQAWVDAVNAAYDRGTAMFAAESDFFSLSFDPLPTLGLVLPSSPVYPAGFRRVLGVTGVTAEGRSYGRNSLWRLLSHPLAVDRWALRGCYGADGTSTALLRPNTYPDGSELKYGGSLRPQPIAAFSPNVPWLAVRYPDKVHPEYVVDLTGAGTSASTPQVAAAAALWLQKHRHEFSNREWHGWQKAEAVYCALLLKASLPGHPDRTDPFLGAGVLKARQSLAVSYAQLKRMTKPPGETEYQREHRQDGRTLYFDWTREDHFDAERSLRALVGLQTYRKLSYTERAALCQEPMPHASPADSLRRFYYNTLLLRAWQDGHQPDKHDGTDDLWVEADRRVARTLPGYRSPDRATLLDHVHATCQPPPDDPLMRKDGLRSAGFPGGQ